MPSKSSVAALDEQLHIEKSPRSFQQPSPQQISPSPVVRTAASEVSPKKKTALIATVVSVLALICVAAGFVLMQQRKDVEAKLEAANVALAKAEADRVAAAKVEAERAAAAKTEAERVAAAKAEEERLATVAAAEAQDAEKPDQTNNLVDISKIDQKVPQQGAALAQATGKNPFSFADEQIATRVLYAYYLREAYGPLGRMLVASVSDDKAAIDNAKLSVEQLKKPSQGDRKVARAANKNGLDALSRKEYAQAIENFERAVAADPADQELTGNLAHAYQEAGKSAEALSAALASLSVNPGRASVWATVGVIFTNKGMASEASGAFMNAARFSTAPAKTKEFFERQAIDHKDEAVRRAYAAAIDRAGRAGLFNVAGSASTSP